MKSRNNPDSFGDSTTDDFELDDGDLDDEEHLRPPFNAELGLYLFDRPSRRDRMERSRRGSRGKRRPPRR